MSLRCLDCRYVWKPRKEITRYRRQCPRCNSYQIEELKRDKEQNGKLEDTEHIEDMEGVEDKRHIAATANIEPSTIPKWSKVVYNLMGLLGADSPENALARAFEFYRLVMPLKFKYGLEDPKDVPKFLENQVVAERKKNAELYKRLMGILEDPTSIFYEIAGADLTAVNYFEALRKNGYPGSFLEFLNEIVEKYFEEYGYRSPMDFAANTS